MLSRFPMIVWTTLGGAVVGLLLAMRFTDSVLGTTLGVLIGLAGGLAIGFVIILFNRANQRDAAATRDRFPGAVVVSTRNDSTSARGLGQLLPWSETSAVLDPTPLVVFDRLGVGFWTGPKKEIRAFHVPWNDVTTFKVGAKGEGNVLDRSPRQLLEFTAVNGTREAKVAIPVVDGNTFLDEAGVRALVAEVKKLRASQPPQ